MMIRRALFVLLGLLPALTALAQNRLSVTRIDPDGGSLRNNDSLDLRVHYQSDQPVRIQAHGMRDGQQVPGATNASPAWPAGEGDVLAWIAYRQYTAIDAVEVVLGDQRWRPLATVVVPVEVDWSEGAPHHARSAWAKELSAQQQSLISTQSQAAIDSQGGDWLISVLFITPPLYLLLQVVLPLVWRGRWRKAALLPLVLMLPALAFSLFALVAQSNLWPLTMIFLSPFLCLYLLVLLALWLLWRWRGGRVSA